MGGGNVSHRTRFSDAHACSDGCLWSYALIRGAGEPEEQPRNRNLWRQWPRHRHLLRAEPLLRSVRGALPRRFDAPPYARWPSRAPRCGGADLYGGCALPQPLGYRYPLALPRYDPHHRYARPVAGWWLDYHSAGSQEPIPPRYRSQSQQGGPHDETRSVEVQGVDHGPQARAQLHQGGDRGDVPQYGGVRL